MWQRRAVTRKRRAAALAIFLVQVVEFYLLC
jgi:hypothetical protein